LNLAGSWVAILGFLTLAGCEAHRNAPLWPGSRYTEADRSNAIMRALDYIQRSAQNPKNFAADGSDFLFCFYSIANSARDPALRTAAASLGRETAQRWAKTNGTVAATASEDEVADLVFGWLAASQLGQDDTRIKPALRRAAARFTAVDYLLFDPAKEPPPSDLPERCRYDFVWNARGATVCRKCGRALRMRSKYDIWLDALISTYTGERYGIRLGSSYRDVLRWIPSMRPYLDRSQAGYATFIDTVYAVTHVVYTLNDYGTLLLPRELLPQEYSYLKQNLGEAIALKDPETMGEFLDTLKSFGMNVSDGEIRTGMKYLLDTQRAEGTWSAPDEKDPYTLYHSAWTGIDGLKDCLWRGQGLSFPELQPLLEGIR
jgi:hypothetical protein